MQLKTACYKIQESPPQAVLYVATGGHALGMALAEQLNVPLFSIDVRYPLSRFMEKFPILAPFCWLIKETLYRFTPPTLTTAASRNSLPAGLTRVILADDRVSSGRTLKAVLVHLKTTGIEKKHLRVVTWRCGENSRHLVDYVIDKAK